MHNILIVGAGQLGSRHLQGALLSKSELQITVVDPSQISLNVAEERAGQVELGNIKSIVTYRTNMPKDESIDICIIATSANVRAIVTKELLTLNKVKHIIFEKVLFQKLTDFTEIPRLLNDSVTTGWVNCPRRVYPTYMSLQALLDRSQPIKMTVKGNSWGMACNSVHFLDIFAFLVGDSSLEMMESKLDPLLFESKRAGFYEITGRLSFTAGKHSLTVESGSNQIPECIVSLENEKTKYVVDEAAGTWIQSIAETEIQHIHTPLFQSQLTGGIVDELLESNGCGLTPLTQSCELHIPFITSLLTHMSAVLKKDLDSCPIT